MLKIKTLSLDVLKPSDLPTVDLMKELEKSNGVTKIDITLVEFERNTDTLKVGIEGTGLNIDEITKCIASFGGVIQNIEHIVAEKV